MHKSRLIAMVIDCNVPDVDAAAEFWSRAIGRGVKPPQPDFGNYRTLQTKPGEAQVLVQKVTHPSRVHLDIESTDVEAEVRRLEKLGAKRVEKVRTWWIMEAPTGQRFCVVRPQSDTLEQDGNVWDEPDER